MRRINMIKWLLQWMLLNASMFALTIGVIWILHVAAANYRTAELGWSELYTPRYRTQIQTSVKRADVLDQNESTIFMQTIFRGLSHFACDFKCKFVCISLVETLADMCTENCLALSSNLTVFAIFSRTHAIWNHNSLAMSARQSLSPFPSLLCQPRMWTGSMLHLS